MYSLYQRLQFVRAVFLVCAASACQAADALFYHVDLSALQRDTLIQWTGGRLPR